MNRHLHRLAPWAAFLPAAVASLMITGASLASAPAYHMRPLSVAPAAGTPQAAGARPLVSRSLPIISKSTTLTPQQAARFRAKMDQIPHLNQRSGRAQVRAFVAYFKAKGFHPTVYTAKYAPSGRIATLEYHAKRSSRSTNKVDVSFSKRGDFTAISMN